ncbi:hypothetical protein [Corynebacterium senegalense]|uniref:hypothetical protein n=1 Tax=Corynebacterium senegalense TaxID=2080750 RepID=UPI0015F27B4F|nr:hypothetical protein [Corynebacterium senegalense]
MRELVVAQQRPSETWLPPNKVVGEISSWLGTAMYITLGLSILAVIVFGALLVVDRDRGEPVSATAPHMRALQIALGVFIISGAASLAGWLV